MMKRLLIAMTAVAFLAVLAAPANADDPKPEVKPKVESKVKVEGKVVVTPEAPASAPAKDVNPAPPVKDDDIKGALDVGKNAVAAAKDGRWWLFSALVITVLMFLTKFIGKRQGFWAKLGRLRYVLPPALSLVAALLATFQGGVSIDAAITVFTSSYATSSLQELWEHGILNKPRASAGG